MAQEFHSDCAKISNNFPHKFYYLADQLKRASLSVILNIAEGSGKESDKDFRRYLMNSLGSINEAAACLDVAYRQKLIVNEKFEKLISNCWELKNRLGFLAKKIKLQLADSSFAGSRSVESKNKGV